MIHLSLFSFPADTKQLELSESILTKLGEMEQKMNLQEVNVQKAIAQLASTVTAANESQEKALSEANAKVIEALQKKEGDFSDEIKMIQDIEQKVKDANQKQVEALKGIVPEVAATLEHKSPSESVASSGGAGSAETGGSTETTGTESGGAATGGSETGGTETTGGGAGSSETTGGTETAGSVTGSPNPDETSS